MEEVFGVFDRLIASFLGRKSAPADFKRLFLEAYGIYHGSEAFSRIDAATNAALSEIYAAVDRFTENEESRDGVFDTGEEELRADVRFAYDDLQKARDLFS